MIKTETSQVAETRQPRHRHLEALPSPAPVSDSPRDLARWWWESQPVTPAGGNRAWFAVVRAIEAALDRFGTQVVRSALRRAEAPLTTGSLAWWCEHPDQTTRPRRRRAAIANIPDPPDELDARDVKRWLAWMHAYRDAWVEGSADPYGQANRAVGLPRSASNPNVALRLLPPVAEPVPAAQPLLSEAS